VSVELNDFLKNVYSKSNLKIDWNLLQYYHINTATSWRIEDAVGNRYEVFVLSDRYLPDQLTDNNGWLISNLLIQMEIGFKSNIFNAK